MTHEELEQLVRELPGQWGPFIRDFYYWSDHIWGWIIVALIAGFVALRIVAKMLAWKQIHAESLAAWSGWGIARLLAKIALLAYIIFALGGPVFLIALCHW